MIETMPRDQNTARNMKFFKVVLYLLVCLLISTACSGVVRSHSKPGPYDVLQMVKFTVDLATEMPGGAGVDSLPVRLEFLNKSAKILRLSDEAFDEIVNSATLIDSNAFQWHVVHRTVGSSGSTIIWEHFGPRESHFSAPPRPALM